MKQTLFRITTTLLALLGLLAQPSLASPGAHGPNGEHLDAPTSAAAGGAASPRLEARTELFELVATLAGGELSILIDRFETNEPLLKAVVEVESGGLKAKARFHADQGDYAVDDAAMLKLLGKPGAHALVITVLAGQESDLLDGTLNVPTPEADHGHGAVSTATWLGATVLALALLLIAFALRKRRFKFKGDAA